MTETERVFLTIIRDSIHPENDLNIIKIPDLSAEWSAVLDTAKKQNLFPVLYDAATVYPSFAKFDETHPECFTAATAAMTAQMHPTEAFLDLSKCFLSAGISPITMKGIICRDLYGDKADFRPSVDKDSISLSGEQCLCATKDSAALAR